MKGGNYETDVTSQTIDGIPTRNDMNVIITQPGFPPTDAKSWKQRQEDMDQRGDNPYNI